MNNNTILRQKSERDILLAKAYVERTKMTEAKKMIDSNLITVVMGPRRAGKSVFSLHLLEGRDPVYINFDDPDFSGILDYDQLQKNFTAVYGDNKTLLFDEIQNIPRWELWVSRFQRQGYRILLTGSNANLLSQELATHLTGRHFPVEIFPYSFSEWIRARGESFTSPIQLPEDHGRMVHLFQQFLISGGFPELVSSTIDHDSYVSTLFTSVIFKDIVARYRLRFPNKIYQLATLMLQQAGLPMSARKLSRMLPMKSATTLLKYLGYLEETYLFYALHRYSFKSIERIKSIPKIYCIDNGYLNSLGVFFSQNRGRLMENLIFTELLKRGAKPNHNFFYYKTRNDREIDFVLKKGLAVDELIQVAYEINPEVEKREIKALMEACEEMDANRLTVLTWDTKKEVKKGKMVIHFLPVWEWLMDQK